MREWPQVGMRGRWKPVATLPAGTSWNPPAPGGFTRSPPSFPLVEVNCTILEVRPNCIGLPAVIRVLTDDGLEFDPSIDSALFVPLTTDNDWRSDEIGRLMVAATLVTDEIESMWTSDHNDPMPRGLASIVAEVRAAVSRESRQ